MKRHRWIRNLWIGVAIIGFTVALICLWPSTPHPEPVDVSTLYNEADAAGFAAGWPSDSLTDLELYQSGLSMVAYIQGTRTTGDTCDDVEAFYSYLDRSGQARFARYTLEYYSGIVPGFDTYTALDVSCG